MDIQWEGSDLGRQPGHGPVQPTALEKLVGVVDTGAPSIQLNRRSGPRGASIAPGPNPKSAAAAPAPPNIKPRGKNSASSASLVCCEPTADALHLPCFPSSLSREADPEEDAAAMPKGRRKKGAKAQRLVDPAPEIDVDALVKYLTGKPEIDPKECNTFEEVPDEYLNETPAVQAKNRGVNTLYGRMAHLRRRYLVLLLHGNVRSPEGDFIVAKMKILEEEVYILHGDVVKLNGVYFQLPEVFLQAPALRTAP